MTSSLTATVVQYEIRELFDSTASSAAQGTVAGKTEPIFTIGRRSYPGELELVVNLPGVTSGDPLVSAAEAQLAEHGCVIVFSGPCDYRGQPGSAWQVVATYTPQEREDAS